MKSARRMAPIAAFLLSAGAAWAEAPQPPPQTGDAFEITVNRESVSQGSGGSSSTSHDRDTMMERVVAVRADGVELEYDLPSGIPAEERARHWQFPVRVFRPHHGPLLLLNRAELETRVDAWLRTAGWTREVCGRWIFTWNVFRIECDPESVIETLQLIDLSFSDLREGALYRDPHARAPAPVARTAPGANGATFVVEMEIDADAMRRGRAESDVIVAEITGETLTLAAALRERAREAVSGTISVTFETDSAGNVWRRTKVVRTETRTPNGETESETSTETIERRAVARNSSG